MVVFDGFQSDRFDDADLEEEHLAWVAELLLMTYLSRIGRERKMIAQAIKP